MSKSEIARIRMEPGQYAKWSELAQVAGMALGPFLLRRLEEGASIEEQINNLRSTLSRIEHATLKPGSAPAGKDDSSVLVELLLLLRNLSKPQSVVMVQSELQRLGLKAWTPPSE